jgi:hypothetical protein
VVKKKPAPRCIIVGGIVAGEAGVVREVAMVDLSSHLWIVGLVPIVILSLNQPQVGAAAGDPQALPGKAVVDYLDRLYRDIEAKHPNPAVPPSKGLMKTKPIVDDDVTRETYRAASALARVLGYDFVKLAVIEHYGRQANISGSGAAKVGEGITRVIEELPDGQPGVAEAKQIGSLLWLCRHPFMSTYSRSEIIRRTDEYLGKALPAAGQAANRGLAVLGAFELACTIGTPPATLRPITPLMRNTLFARAAKVADLTGLPFERVARVESVNGPLVLWNLVRSLPKEHAGRDAALAALALDKDWR